MAQDGQHHSDNEVGFLWITTDIDSVIAVIDGDPAQRHYLTKGRNMLRLPEGHRRVMLASPVAIDHRFAVQISAGQITEYTPELHVVEYLHYYHYSSYPFLHWNANLIVYTDLDADIYLDGEMVGTGHVRLNVTPGLHHITAQHPVAGNKRTAVEVPEQRTALVELFTRPSRDHAVKLMVVPGASQLYKGEVLKSAFVGGSFLATAGMALFSQLRSQDAMLQLEEVRTMLQFLPEEEWELDWRAEAAFWRAGLERHRRSRTVWASAAGAAYLLNVVDALRTPRSGYRQRERGSTVLEPFVHGEGGGLTFSIRF